MKEIVDVRFNHPFLTPFGDQTTFRCSAEVILILAERGYAVKSESDLGGVILTPKSEVTTVRFMAGADSVRNLRDRLTGILEQIEQTDRYFGDKPSAEASAEPAPSPINAKD